MTGAEATDPEGARRSGGARTAAGGGIGPTVETVLGPVSADDFGPTLVHEHLLIDLWPWFDAPEAGASASERAIADLTVTDDPLVMEIVRANPFAVRDNLVLDDTTLAVVELARFAAAGGRTVVDLTLDEIGRDPAALRDIALRTGLNVVMGCGHYVGRAHPAGLADLPEEAIRDEMIRDLTEGVAIRDSAGAATVPGRPTPERVGDSAGAATVPGRPMPKRVRDRKSVV